MSDNVRTNKELYFQLRKFSFIEEFIEWMDTPWGDGRDKLEAVFRLYSRFGMHWFQKLYRLCVGKFNKGGSVVCTDAELVKMFDQNVKDSGSWSDETFIDKENNTILAFTSKNYTTEDWIIGDLDISKIYHALKEKYPKFKHKIGFVVRDKKVLYRKLKNAKDTSELCKKVILEAKKDNLIFDINDLANMLCNLPKKLPTKLNKVFMPFPHQKLSFLKLKEIFKETDMAVLNSLPRSGKTYVMGLCALNLEELVPTEKSHNILLVTLRPSENLPDYKKFFEVYLPDYNVIFLGDSKDKKPVLKEKNIIIVSKQFLQGKLKDENTESPKSRKIDWLVKLPKALMMVDEPHDGGSTNLASSVYEMYGKNTKTLLVTATCGKPVQKYKIDRKYIVKWDLEDVNLCRNLNIENKKKLIEKHGSLFEQILKETDEKAIEKIYGDYPNLVLLNYNFERGLKQDIKEEGLGWSIDAVLSMDDEGNFRNKDMAISLFKSIFGEVKYVGKSKKLKKKDESSCMYYCKKIIEKNGSRKNDEKPVISMVFVDRQKITMLGPGIKDILEKNVFPDFAEEDKPEIVVLSVKENKGQNSLERIDEAYNRAVNNKKKSVLVISGYMCSAAASIPKADIAFLLHSETSWDFLYQQAFRPLTQDIGKTCGIVCDLNNQRRLSFMAVLTEHIYGNSGIENIQKLVKENIVQIVEPEWYNKETGIFETKELEIKKLVETVHKTWMADVGATRTIIRALTENAEVSSKYVNIFNKEFKQTGKNKKKGTNPEFIVDDIPDELQGRDRDMDSGIEEKRVTTEEEEENGRTKSKEMVVNMFKEVFTPFVVMLNVLTLGIEKYDFSELCDFVINDKESLEIILNRLQSNWGTKVSLKTISYIREVYEAELKHNSYITDNLIYLKQRFMAVRKKPKKLYRIIEEFLVPTQFERDENAEISTPPELRKKMLSCIPDEDWLKGLILEPCCGKGGFLVDIVDKLMNILADKIPDKKERRRHILEERLYFADKSPINIYACRKILDPLGEYELNYYIGDTFELDIYEKWGIRNFGLCIGNPPYKKGLYIKFTDFVLSFSDRLLFVIPSSFTIGVSREKFRKSLKNSGLKKVQFLDRTAFNNAIDIDTLFFYCTKNYKGNILVNNIEVDREDYILNYNKTSYSIFKKLKSFEHMNLLKGKNKTLSFKNPSETSTIKYRKTDTHIHELLSRLGKGEPEIYYISNPIKDTTGNKVVFPRGTASYNNKNRLMDLKRDIVHSMYIDGDKHISTGLVYFQVENEEEGKNLRWYILRSILVRFLFLNLNFFSEFTIGFANNIPKINFDRKLTDLDVFEYFGLTKEEQQYIYKFLEK